MLRLWFHLVIKLRLTRAFQIPTLAPKEMPGRTESMSARLQSIKCRHLSKELEKKQFKLTGPKTLFIN